MNVIRFEPRRTTRPAPKQRVKKIVRQGDRYVSGRDVKDIAKDLRKDIREAIRRADLPQGLKTSVRIERYSMGRSINVRVVRCPVLVVCPERARRDAKGDAPWGPWKSEPGTRIHDTLTQLVQRYQLYKTTDQPDDWSYQNFFYSVSFDSDITEPQRKGILQTPPNIRIIPRNW